MNLETITKQAIVLVKETAEYIQQQRHNIKDKNIETKGLHDYVTFVDKTSEQRLVDGLSKLLPGSGFITEEETIANKQKEYTWIIDPLDGTTNYIHGIPVYSISVALRHNQKTIAGIVYEINQNECFYSWQNAPVFLNDSEVAVTQTKTIDQSLLATGFPYYDYQKLTPYLRHFAEILQKSRGVRRLGSAAVDLAYVACGRFDGFYEYSLHAWDVAAGAFLVQQAGGVVSDFKGENNFLFGGEILATNPDVFDDMLEHLKKYFVSNANS
ncbi:MAG: inositol monophosphatase family protein [Bacteroidales bacterium]